MGIGIIADDGMVWMAGTETTMPDTPRPLELIGACYRLGRRRT